MNLWDIFIIGFFTIFFFNTDNCTQKPIAVHIQINFFLETFTMSEKKNNNF